MAEVPSKIHDTRGAGRSDGVGRVRKAAVAAGLLTGTAALLFPLFHTSIAAHTRLGREILDFTHVPVFAAISLLLLCLTTVLGGSRLRPRWAHYALAATVALAMAVVSEVAQYFGNRDADIVDLLRNGVGMAAGLCWTGTLDRRLVAEFDLLARPRARWLVRSAAVLGLLLALAPVVLTAWAYRERDGAMPLLRGFDSTWERRFLDVANAAVDVTPPPAGWVRGRDDLVGRVTFSRVRWPAARFEECYPDWTPYESLVLDLYSESAGTHRLGLSVEDVEYASNEDRFNLEFDLPPGPTTIRVPLAEVRSAPAGRELDLARVNNVFLFAFQPPESFAIWVDDLRLEGARSASVD